MHARMIGFCKTVLFTDLDLLKKNEDEYFFHLFYTIENDIFS